MIYGRLKDADKIAQRSISQLYDPEKEMFLSDRFIKGNVQSAAAQISMATIVNPAHPPMMQPI